VPLTFNQSSKVGQCVFKFGGLKKALSEISDCFFSTDVEGPFEVRLALSKDDTMAPTSITHVEDWPCNWGEVPHTQLTST
jgi:hypothetical protein